MSFKKILASFHYMNRAIFRYQTIKRLNDARNIIVGYSAFGRNYKTYDAAIMACAEKGGGIITMPDGAQSRVVVNNGSIEVETAE